MKREYRASWVKGKEKSIPLITPFGLTSFLDPIDHSFNNIKATPGGACIGHPVKRTFILQRSMVSRQTDRPRPTYPPSDASCVSTVARTMPPLEHPVNSAHEAPKLPRTRVSSSR